MLLFRRVAACIDHAAHKQNEKGSGGEDVKHPDDRLLILSRFKDLREVLEKTAQLRDWTRLEGQRPAMSPPRSVPARRLDP